MVGALLEHGRVSTHAKSSRSAVPIVEARSIVDLVKRGDWAKVGIDNERLPTQKIAIVISMVPSSIHGLTQIRTANYAIDSLHLTGQNKGAFNHDSQ